MIESEELMKPSALNNEEKSSQRSPTIKGKILGIISGITNKSNAMEPFNEQSLFGEVEIPKSSGINPLERGSLAKGVSGTGISGTYNLMRSSSYYSASTVPTSKQLQARKEITQSQLNSSFSQSDLSIDCKDFKNEKPHITTDAVEVPRVANTSKLSSGNDSDSGINSPGLASSSRRSSIRSTLSSAEKK